jgi:hypothetical protein
VTASGPDIERMLVRQRVLASLGEFALQSEELDAVLTEACRLVSEAFGTERAIILEIGPESHRLFAWAGVGSVLNVIVARCYTLRRSAVFLLAKDSSS